MAQPPPHPPVQHNEMLQRPSFFRILAGQHWNERLRFPSLFVSLYSNELQAAPHMASLKTHYGTWIVRMEYTNEAICAITDGWPGFVDGNNLVHGELLLFNALDSSHFEVFAYSRYGCATILPVSLQNQPQPQPALFCMEEFIALKSYNRYNMNIRKCFMRRTGLSNMEEVSIFNSSGISWLVAIKDGRRLGPGWARFWMDTNLSADENYKLKCFLDVDRNLIKVEFVKA